MKNANGMNREAPSGACRGGDDRQSRKLRGHSIKVLFGFFLALPWLSMAALDACTDLTQEDPPSAADMASTNCPGSDVQAALQPPATNFSEKLDRLHNAVHGVAQHAVESADALFAHTGEQPLPVPPMHLRLGLYAKVDLQAESKLTLTPLVDSTFDINVPNIERRLKLYITTMDPTKMPGTDVLEKNTSLRLGVERSWTDDFHAALGVRVQWLPVVYGKIDWSPLLRINSWRFFPQQKVYWESDTGPGEVTTFITDFWRNRMGFRSTSAVKWSREKQWDDNDEANDENGWQWEQSLGVGYVKEFLEERDVGRLASGDDIADGQGMQFALFGGPETIHTARITLFYKAPLYSRWVFYSIAPGIEWTDDNNWERDWFIKIGVETLFWGAPDR